MVDLEENNIHVCTVFSAGKVKGVLLYLAVYEKFSVFKICLLVILEHLTSCHSRSKHD